MVDYRVAEQDAPNRQTQASRRSSWASWSRLLCGRSPTLPARSRPHAFYRSAKTSVEQLNTRHMRVHEASALESLDENKQAMLVSVQLFRAQFHWRLCHAARWNTCATLVWNLEVANDWQQVFADGHGEAEDLYNSKIYIQ